MALKLRLERKSGSRRARKVRADHLAAVLGLARRNRGKPGHHDLPERQGHPDRQQQGHRPAVGFRAHTRAADGRRLRRTQACDRLARPDHVFVDAAQGEKIAGRLRRGIRAAARVLHRRSRRPRPRLRWRRADLSSSIRCSPAWPRPAPPTASGRMWRPPFVSRLAAEDRCHLNGLALRDGRPAYVTASPKPTWPTAGATTARRRRGRSTCAANEIVCRGLSMPHSPRLARRGLWVLNSGTGEIGIVDL